jgi:phospholipase/lecithinase/hemolysin
MKFRSTVLRAAGATALAALLASCGGESDGLVAFVPARILVFGDQSSVITADARKHTINAVNTDGSGAVNCSKNPIWTQVLATFYGKGFPECPLASETTAPSSRILAQDLATAGGDREIDLAGQVTRQLERPAADGGGIGPNDMVSVLIGVNDVVAAYELWEAGEISEAQAVALAEQAGVAIASQVNRIAAAGGKVIISTVPDVSVTPYGRSKGITGVARLSYLTARVNGKVLVTIENNGRKIGLIELNQSLISVVGAPTAYGYVNVQDAACVPPDPLNCTTSTLKTNPIDGTSAGAYTWLWASALQLSPGGHLQLGNLATSRARNQPF